MSAKQGAMTCEEKGVMYETAMRPKNLKATEKLLQAPEKPGTQD